MTGGFDPVPDIAALVWGAGEVGRQLHTLGFPLVQLGILAYATLVDNARVHGLLDSAPVVRSVATSETLLIEVRQSGVRVADVGPIGAPDVCERIRLAVGEPDYNPGSPGTAAGLYWLVRRMRQSCGGETTLEYAVGPRRLRWRADRWASRAGEDLPGLTTTVFLAL